MSMILVEMIPQRMGLAPLHKINQAGVVTSSPEGGSRQLLAQAVIPAVIVGFCKWSRSQSGVDQLLSRNPSTGWETHLFGDRSEEVIRKISQFAAANETATRELMIIVADEVLEMTREQEFTQPEAFKEFFAAQKQTVSLYLPEELGITDYVDDYQLAEGNQKSVNPITAFMQPIENTLSDTPVSKQ